MIEETLAEDYTESKQIIEKIIIFDKNKLIDMKLHLFAKINLCCKNEEIKKK